MPGPAKRSNAHKTAKHSRKIHHGEDIAPDILTKIPDPPVDLQTEGRVEWKRICGLLIEQNILTEWDLPSLKIMCMEWERYVNAVRDIEQFGTYQKAVKSGYEQQRPVVAERDKGFSNYSKMLDLFGGNVVSRARMKRIKPVEANANPYDTL